MSVSSDRIHLQGIRMLSGGVETDPSFRKKPRKIGKYDFYITYDSSLELGKARMYIEIEVALKGLHTSRTGKETELGVRAEYSYEFLFEVENLKELVDESDSIDPHLMMTLVSIAYSTLRGILLERTNGTLLNGVILPIINPGVLVNEHRNPASQV